jgi:mycoketide-CoA synthase
VAVADVDWSRFADTTRVNPLLGDLTEAGPAAAETLQQRLAGVGDRERDRLLLELVRGHAAVVLGHPDGVAIAADRSFRDLAFDSVTAVELRNRLQAAAGMRLPATVVFDHPTPAALAGHLHSLVAPEEPVTTEPAPVPDPEGPAPDADLESATDDELFEIIDEELGLS